MLRGGALLIALISILIRPADYISPQLRAAGPHGLSAADLAPAILLFLIGTSAALSKDPGKLRLRKAAVLIVLAAVFWGRSFNHLMPIGQFFLAALSSCAAAAAAAARPLRQRAIFLAALIVIPMSARAFNLNLHDDVITLLFGAMGLAAAGSLAGGMRLSLPLHRFLIRAGALAAIFFGIAALLYIPPRAAAGPLMTDPNTLEIGFMSAAAAVSIGLLLLASVLIDRLRVPFLFSPLIVFGENALAFWLIPFLVHVFVFSRFMVETAAGPVLLRDRMFNNMMDMWNQTAANVIYTGLIIFFGVFSASALSDRRLRIKL